MEPLDLQVLGHHQLKGEWKSVITTSGALYVMTHGATWMLVLHVYILATAMKVQVSQV